MRRREFVAGGVLAGLAAAGRTLRAVQEQGPQWWFGLDEGSRWALDGERGAVLSGGRVAIELEGMAPVPLDRLDQLRRLRPDQRRGETTTVIGRIDDVEVAAHFAPGAAPSLTVQVRGLGAPRHLTAIAFAEALAVPWRAAWYNGYQSWSGCGIARPREAAVSHGQVALWGAQEHLAMAFGPEDAGAGEFRLAGGRLSMVSRTRRRTVSVDHPPASATVVFLPGRDPLAALGRLAAETARSRMASSPAGWRSWYAHFENVSEGDILEALDVLRRRVDPRDCPWIEVDDGYQRAAGDWDTGARFPHGHAWLTERIRQAGFRPALWLAPFLAGPGSGIASGHPEWLLAGGGERPLEFEGRPHWGRAVGVLDASRRDVRDWLRRLARRAVDEWGYELLRLDYLHLGALGRPAGGMSPHEALRGGLRALREGAHRAVLIGGAAPFQHVQGLFDSVVTGDLVRSNWDGARAGARGALLRAHLNGRAWTGDPEALLVEAPLDVEEARAWASVVAVCGGGTMLSGPLSGADAERLDILRRVVPAATLHGEPLDLLATGSEEPPSLILARSGEDRWMLVAVNWGATPRRFSADLSRAVSRGRLAAWDVWSGTRRADVTGRLSLEVAPHAATVLALRRVRAGAFVLGTTRHVVQGAVDLLEEAWDQRRRVLRGRSVGLDRHPYTVAIAVPSGLHPVRCAADVPCEVEHLHRSARAALLRFAQTPREVEWEVGFG